MRARTIIVAVAAMLLAPGAAQAVVGIETVPVGDPGNAADKRSIGGSGAVSYTYNIGKYEVTAGQYTAFLNAVAATDTYGLYNIEHGRPGVPLRLQHSAQRRRRAATRTAWPPTGPTAR